MREHGFAERLEGLDHRERQLLRRLAEEASAFFFRASDNAANVGLDVVHQSLSLLCALVSEISASARTSSATTVRKPTAVMPARAASDRGV